MYSQKFVGQRKLSFLKNGRVQPCLPIIHVRFVMANSILWVCVCVCACMCACVFFYLLHTKLHSTIAVGTFLEGEGILPGPHNFKGLYEG